MFKIHKMDLLISIYIFCIAISELMGGKSFVITTYPITLTASVAIFVIPLIFSINDIIAEVYGAERARSVVRSGLFAIFLIILFTFLATSLPPTQRFLANEASYDKIFTISTRIAIASLIAFAFSDLLDVYIFSKIREKMGKSKLWLRNNLSNFIAQLIDTVIFLTLAFYGLDQSFTSNISFLFSIGLPYYLLKCFMSIIETPLVYIGVNWLKKDKP